MSDPHHRQSDMPDREFGHDGADHGIDLHRIVGVFRRRRGLFLVTVLAGTALAGIVTWQLSPRYSATATVMIEPQQMRVLDAEAVAEGLPAWQSGTDTPLATQVNVLGSRGHARRVVEALQLTAVAEFQPQPAWWEGIELEPVVDWAHAVGIMAVEWVSAHLLASVASSNDAVMIEPGLQLSVDDAPSRAATTIERPADRQSGAVAPVPADPVETAVDELLGRLSVHRDGQSQAIVVGFTSGDPHLAASLANAVVDLYLARQLEEKVAATDAAERWVEERVASLREALLDAERRVVRYRAEHDLLESREGSFDSQQLDSLNAQLIAARAERQAKEARLQRIRELQATGGLNEALAEFAGSPLIAALRQQDAELRRMEAQLAQELGAQHPRMLQARAEREDNRRKLNAEIATVIGGLADEVDFVAGRERAIEASLEQAKGLSTRLRDASVELHDLEREAAAQRTAFEKVLGRLQELQEQRDLIRPDAVVLSSAAVPDRPSFPKKGLMLAVGFVGSMGLGVLLVALAELLDRSLRSAREVEQRLGLPMLAMVPKVRHLRRGLTPALYLGERPASGFAEALREIEAGCAPALAGPMTILVTSSLPGEGKTSLATSLALVAARGGRRTLLVDLDIRHPSAERALGMDRSGGLTDCLRDGKPVSRAVRVMPAEPNLHVLGNAGTRTGESEIANWHGIGQLFAELRLSYQLIVIDSPPLLGLADTKQIAVVADKVLFAVRWGGTPATAARAALQSLRGAGANVVGAVLTLVDLKRHARYGYGDAGAYYNTYKKYYIN